MSSSQELQEILDQGTQEQCLAFFADIGEERRSDFEELAQDAIDKVGAVSVLDPAYRSPAWKLRRAVAVTALVATTTPEGLARRHAWMHEQDYAILRQRPRAWVEQFVDILVQRSAQDVHWVLPAVELGLCDRPTHDHFTFGLITSILNDESTPAATRQERLQQALRDSATFLSEHLWRVLDPRTPAELAEGYGRWIYKDAEIWGAALAQLANDGLLDRDRLLDAPLQALAHDVHRNQGPRYGALHESLKPTLEERGQRLPQYLQLLGCDARTSVAFALKALAVLDKASMLPAGQLLEHVEPALHQKTKGSVLQALKLLTNACKRDHAIAREAARMATRALVHEHADVQQRALQLVVEVFPEASAMPESVRSALDEHADLVRPSVQAEFADWLPKR